MDIFNSWKRKMPIFPILRFRKDLEDFFPLLPSLRGIKVMNSHLTFPRREMGGGEIGGKASTTFPRHWGVNRGCRCKNQTRKPALSNELQQIYPDDKLSLWATDLHGFN